MAKQQLLSGQRSGVLRMSSCFNSRQDVKLLQIDVRQPSDVIAALAFSKLANVALSVKNTGHDYKGRSAMKGSLSLWVCQLSEQTATLTDIMSVDTQPEGNQLQHVVHSFRLLEVEALQRHHRWRWCRLARGLRLRRCARLHRHRWIPSDCRCLRRLAPRRWSLYPYSGVRSRCRSCGPDQSRNARWRVPDCERVSKLGLVLGSAWWWWECARCCHRELAGRRAQGDPSSSVSGSDL
jgi:hypothetical protein